MDKDTISELCHALIATLIAMMVIAVLTSSVFLNKNKELVDNTVPEHEQQKYQTDDAFQAYLDGVSQ